MTEEELRVFRALLASQVDVNRTLIKLWDVLDLLARHLGAREITEAMKDRR